MGGVAPVGNAQSRNGHHVSDGLEEQVVAVLVEHRLCLQLHEEPRHELAQARSPAQ